MVLMDPGRCRRGRRQDVAHQALPSWQAVAATGVLARPRRRACTAKNERTIVGEEGVTLVSKSIRLVSCAQPLCPCCLKYCHAPNAGVSVSLHGRDYVAFGSCEGSSDVDYYYLGSVNFPDRHLRKYTLCQRVRQLLISAKVFQIAKNAMLPSEAVLRTFLAIRPPKYATISPRTCRPAVTAKSTYECAVRAEHPIRYSRKSSNRSALNLN